MKVLEKGVEMIKYLTLGSLCDYNGKKIKAVVINAETDVIKYVDIDRYKDVVKKQYNGDCNVEIYDIDRINETFGEVYKNIDNEYSKHQSVIMKIGEHAIEKKISVHGGVECAGVYSNVSIGDNVNCVDMTRKCLSKIEELRLSGIVSFIEPFNVKIVKKCRRLEIPLGVVCVSGIENVLECLKLPKYCSILESRTKLDSIFNRNNKLIVEYSDRTYIRDEKTTRICDTSNVHVLDSLNGDIQEEIVLSNIVAIKSLAIKGSHCKKLTIGKTIKEIYGYAFDSNLLKQIEFMGCPNYIDETAFKGAENLEKIIIPRLENNKLRENIEIALEKSMLTNVDIIEA